MSPKTQQKILKALHRVYTDLDLWLKKLGVLEAEVVRIYVSIVRENGFGAQLVSGLTTKVFPPATNVSVNPKTIVKELREARSGKYAAWLLTQPEPAPAELAELLKYMKDALPNLRQHFLTRGKAGPRPRRGPKPRNLTDPVIRERIRAKIASLRGPGTKLDDIFGRLENEYPGVKSSTFKRIWQEGLKKKVK